MIFSGEYMILGDMIDVCVESYVVFFLFLERGG